MCLFCLGFFQIEVCRRRYGELDSFALMCFNVYYPFIHNKKIKLSLEKKLIDWGSLFGAELLYVC